MMKHSCTFMAAAMLLAGLAGAQEIKAQNAGAVKAAIARAKPGDTILIPPGTYDMGGSFSTGKNGTKAKPITLRAEGEKGYAVLKVRGTVGFRVRSKHWVLRGLHIQGSNRSTQATVFMDGPAGCGNIHMLDCKISGSAGHGMKSSRTRTKAVDNVVIEHTELFDTAQTGFDLVSGDNWVLRRNYVHDFGKRGGVTYGIFLKGGGKKGIIEGNIVDGRKQRTTLGISFGGGKTGKKWLPLAKSGKVAAEHDGGICRNNIVIAAADSSYHTNNGANCRFYNNLTWKCTTFQRQAAYPKDPVLINNLIGGRTNRGTSVSKSNLAPRKAWFVDPDKMDFRLTAAGKAALIGKGAKVPLAENPTDFFGNKRDPAKPVIGPVLPDARQSTKWVDRRK
jgi:Right handed beta helix region